MNNSIQFSDGFKDKSEASFRKMMALYARVSISEQAEEGYSIDKQVSLYREKGGVEEIE